MNSSSPAQALPEAPDVESIVTEDEAPVDNLFSEKQQRLLTLDPRPSTLDRRHQGLPQRRSDTELAGEA